MKCHDPDSNSIVSAYVRADNAICSEYNVSNTDRTIQSWIPLQAGQTITLGCHVRTTATRYQMDLIVDGILRNTKLVENKSSRLKYELFDEAYFRERTFIQRGGMKVTSQIILKYLEEAFLSKDVTSEALGALEIRLYKSDTGSNVHKPSTTPFFEVESWRDLRGLQSTGSIEPIHEIQFVHGTRLKSRGQNLLEAKMKEERLGSRQWLSFKFYYRPHFAILSANPKLQVSLKSLIELPRSTPVTTTIANRACKSPVSDLNSADEQNAGKHHDQNSKFGKDQHTTEGLRTESHPISIPSRTLSSEKRDNISSMATEPITPSKSAIANLAPSLVDLSEEAATAQKRLIPHPLPSRAPRWDRDHPDDLHHKPLRSTASSDLLQLLFSENAKCNAAKRQGPNTPENIDVVDRLKTGNSDGSAAVKRRKTDVDQLKVELAEERKVMEESKRYVDELRRKTDERQRQLNEEWDKLQRLRREYKATIEENRRRAEAVSKELEEMDRAKP